MVEQKDFENAIDKRKTARKIDNGLALEYFSHCDFALQNMGWDSLFSFTKSKRLNFIEEANVIRLVRKILDYDFNLMVMHRTDEETLVEEIAERHDFSLDREFFISNTEWENFKDAISVRLLNDEDKKLARRFILASLAWDYPCMSHIYGVKVGDVVATDDGVLINGAKLKGEVYTRCHELLQSYPGDRLLKIKRTPEMLGVQDVQSSREIFEYKKTGRFMCGHSKFYLVYFKNMAIEVYGNEL